MEENNLPDIYSYVNYREYLEDYRLARKKWDDGFTHTYICFKLGQRGSRTLYNNIVKGRKNLTSEFINRLVSLLELNEAESAYFRILVLYNQSTDIQEKELYFEQLVQMNNTPKKELGEESYEYYNRWYYSSIRALLDIFDFKSNYVQLCKKLRPHITVTEAKEAIGLLSRLALIEKNEEGYWKPTTNAITSGTRIGHHAVKKYQLQCLDQAKLAVLDDDPSAFRSSTLTLSISEEGFQRILKRTEQYRKELFAIVNQDESPAEKVYQVNIQLVSQSKSIS